MQVENERKVKVAILTWDEVDFILKEITRGSEGHYIMMKKSIHQEDITIVNIYALNIAALEYITQILMNMKREIDKNIIIVGDFMTSLTTTGRTSRQNQKKILELSHNPEQMNLINMYRPFYQTSAEYSSGVHR